MVYTAANIVNGLLSNHLFYNYIFNTPWPSCVFVFALLFYFSSERLYIRYTSQRFSINTFFVFRLIPALQSLAMVILSVGEIFVSANVNSGLIFFFIGTMALLHYIFSLRLLKKKQEKYFDYIYYTTGALGLIIMSGYEFDANRYMQYFKDRYTQSYEIIMLQDQFKIINNIQTILLRDRNQICQNGKRQQECKNITDILDNLFQFSDQDLYTTANGSHLYHKILHNQQVNKIIDSSPELAGQIEQINKSIQASTLILTGISKLLNIEFVFKIFEYVQNGLIIIIGKLFVAIALSFKITALSIELFSWYKLQQITEKQ